VCILVTYFCIYFNLFPGVKHKYKFEEPKLPKSDQYIHGFLSEPAEDSGIGDQVEVIVTMLPDLAKLIHHVHATLHDNTYKRVAGDFNEWEVVIWEASITRSKSYQ
jgi:hypothetical protein